MAGGTPGEERLAELRVMSPRYNEPDVTRDHEAGIEPSNLAPDVEDDHAHRIDRRQGRLGDAPDGGNQR